MSYLSNKIKRNFTIIPNQLFTDKRLSMGAKVVYCYLGSKPDGWKIINIEVQNSLNISSQTLSKYFKELIDTGWISRKRIVDEEKKFAGGFEYELFNPFDNPNTVKAHITKNYIYGKTQDTYINKDNTIKKDNNINKDILASEKTACKTENLSQDKEKKPKQLTALQEFSNEVIKRFESLEPHQIPIWFRRNCRCLSDILKFCGGRKEDIPTALECISICCSLMEKKGFMAGYEAVCRNLPYYYEEAKKKLRR